MKCPSCNSIDTKVLDTRTTEEASIRRRRQCQACGFRFSTYEVYESKPIMVRKKNGMREIFDKDKIMSGLKKSVYKRPVSDDQLYELINSVERELLDKMIYEIDSTKIGELVMKRLRKIDEVSYVRFASVYKEFSSIDTFLEEISDLKNNTK